jgi:hypothetical protein
MPNALSHMLCVICRLSYAKAHMPVFMCWMPCASCCKLTVKSAYMPISVPVSACSVTDLTCQLQYTSICIPAHECQISVVRCQVSLYANLDCFMTNCYLSVSMPNALSNILYTECNGLYAKLHMLDCNMPNAMTIAMSFRMTTEQVGYFIIYISIIRLWLSILPLQRGNYYYITMASAYISKSQVFQYAGISCQRAKF